jgi:phosphate acetyltransferase
LSLATDLIAELVNDQSIFAGIRERAAMAARTVVFAEGEDERVVGAALAMRELGLARPILVGPPSIVRAGVSAQGADPGSVEVVDPADHAERIAALLLERRGSKGLQSSAAKDLAALPVFLAAGLVALGRADAMVAGAVTPTADVVRAGLWCVGCAEGTRTVSGSFLMVSPDGERALLFADSAVVVEPDEDQLVEIARASAKMWESLFGRAPRIAALSFSTKGSADHPAAQKMARVAERLSAEGHQVDGELQVDAAIEEEIAARKAPGSAISGRADVLLFPDLQSGNIGYKLVQRLGGWRAAGPLVQGLARPVFDLSRGCSPAEIVDTACIAALGAAP